MPLESSPGHGLHRWPLIGPRVDQIEGGLLQLAPRGRNRQQAIPLEIGQPINLRTSTRKYLCMREKNTSAVRSNIFLKAHTLRAWCVLVPVCMSTNGITVVYEYNIESYSSGRALPVISTLLSLAHALPETTKRISPKG